MHSLALRWALLLVLAALAPAQNLADFEKRVTRFTLPNGLRFIVLERHDAPVVSFNALVNAGAVNDPPGESGMAHMFEHMIGKGTRAVGTSDYRKERDLLAKIEGIQDKLDLERRRGTQADPARVKQLEAELGQSVELANGLVQPNEFVKLIEEMGGVGFNAGTGEDNTNYFYSLPSNKLELWFLLQSEWFRRPVFREFYKERDVVREERRMSVESNPIRKLMELLFATAFISHPYRVPTIGWAPEIEALRASNAEKFFATYYVPSNIVIAIVGDVKPEHVKQLATKYFGSIAAGSPPPPVALVEPPQQGPKTIEMISDMQPVAIIGYKRPSQYDKDDPVFDVIQGVLSSGRTGWIYEDLVRDKKIAIAAGGIAAFPGGKYPSLFAFYGFPSPEHTVAENEKALYALIDRLKNSKVDDVTLNRVKLNVRAGLVRQLASNAGLAAQLAFAESQFNDWRKMFTSIDDVEKVTADDIQRVARQYFVEAGRTVAYTAKPPAAKPGAAKTAEGAAR